MDISVIIPIFNVATYIEGCLKSVLSQEFKGSFEIILVDDCGTDNSMDIVNNIIEKYQRASEKNNISIEVINHEKNRGLSAARNTGLEHAKGNYILFVDSDDEITEACLQLLYNAIISDNSDMAIGNYCLVGGCSESLEKDRLKISSDLKVLNLPSSEVLSSYLHGKYYMMAWNKLIKREFLLRHDIRFIEGLIHEDNPWSLLVARHAPKTVLVNHVTYKYLVREGSLQTDKVFRKHFDAYYRILNEECLICTDLVDEINRLAPNWPEDYHHITEAYIRLWIECQKAYFFGQVEKKGTYGQQLSLYKEIQNLMPFPAKSRSHLHYNYHWSIGFLLYKLFYKDYLALNLNNE